ncbi:45092_t:CDS:2, partial [Gigaspora margarita]
MSEFVIAEGNPSCGNDAYHQLELQGAVLEFLIICEFDPQRHWRSEYQNIITQSVYL